MDGGERRAAIARYLEESEKPVSAAKLARTFSVSRQVVVGDVALLRAGGMEISATPRGYIRAGRATGLRRTLACCHSAGQMANELNAIVDHGCVVVDVIVDHPIYGQLTGPLQLASRYDVSQFIARCQKYAAAPLSQLTGGVHLHTILCPDESAFHRTEDALRKLGILLEDSGE